MPSAPSYPGARVPARGDPRPGAEAFRQYQGTADVVALTATMAEIITFAGYPDSIELTATVGNALVELRDLTGAVSGRIFCVAGVPLETRLKARAVFASLAAGVAAANLAAHGKWADPKHAPGDGDPGR